MNPDKSSTVSTDAPIDEPSKKKRKLDQSTTLIPRLVSVAEIIKREFLIDATFREEKLRRSGQVRDPNHIAYVLLLKGLGFQERTLHNKATSVQSGRRRRKYRCCPSASGTHRPLKWKEQVRSLGFMARFYSDSSLCSLQIKRTPYMEIFLCTSELPSTIVGEAT